ncbi:tRNA 2-thiouridine(34) synthase MnmA [Patescibacteria group bacterium]|nr:tRNA 2-thiouridine(34) synthase MnmA [Patescibacteria group bacterium]
MKIDKNFKIMASSMKKTAQKAFVGMSGGVDSSVAAYLLKKQGYDVTGVFLRSYNLDGCAERDAEDARRVAEHIGIPFYVWDTEEDYKKKVVDYMVRGYARGETPNPDVMCNKEIKFGIFYEKALAMGADFIATGHYMRLAHVSRRQPSLRSSDEARPALSLRRSAKGGTEPVGTPRAAAQQERGAFRLLEAKDKNKDQSYFLWTLTQKQLAHCLFPIGEYEKPAVRDIARKAGLPTAEKKDSQGICFLGMVSIDDFLKNYIKPVRGAVVTTDGRYIGEHEGAALYTIGQRHGLNLGAKNRELGIKGKTETKPWYVAEKDVATNTVVVAEGNDNPALYRKEVEIIEVNFISPEAFSILHSQFSIPVMARVRYRQPLVPAKLKFQDSRFKIEFDEPVRFVAKGQSAVFYSAERKNPPAGRLVLGGGVII